MTERSTGSTRTVRLRREGPACRGLRVGSRLLVAVVLALPIASVATSGPAGARSSAADPAGSATAAVVANPTFSQSWRGEVPNAAVST